MRIKDITHAPDGMDQFGIERLIELGAKTAYRHVHDVRVGIEVDIPDVRGDGRAGKHLPTAASQQMEQDELLAGQLHLDAGAYDFAAKDIDIEKRSP